ncbi:MAG: NAD-dependent epimerase/dehydratase family protein [Chakrabartia sp.]
MTILVTGVAGFIGAQLARALLARGAAVIGVDNLNDYYDVQIKRDRLADIAHPRFAFHQIDFADHQALDAALAGTEIESIAHLGAQAGVRYSLINPRAYVQSNLAGHLNLLEVARHRGVRQMIYASSSSVYGANRSLPFRVTDRVDHPVSLYAATKKADELMSETYAHLYRIPLTGLRFFTVYGRWGRPDMAIWSFAEKILTGQPIPVFNKGQMRRDFTHINDIVAGLLAALDQPVADDGAEKPGGSRAPHRLYNIGNNRAEELMRLIAVLEDACGRKAQIDFQPMQPGDVPETYADITDIARDLAFAPATPIDVGVPDFVQWLRAYRGL